MRPGIRLQLLLSLGALLTVAFVPLFFAFARLSEATLLAERKSAVSELGRAVAAHVAEAAERRRDAELEPLLLAQLGDSVVAIGVYGEDGTPRARIGQEAADLPQAFTDTGETGRLEQKPSRRHFRVGYPAHDRRPGVVVLLQADVAAPQLTRLVAAYTAFVAFFLLVFAYFSLTRLVVRPVERLSESARRVAEGSRTLATEPRGARELVDLGTSLRAMTELLFSNEEALLAKVAELERATRELASAQRTLVRSERLASVGRMAAGMAHEIGNPIAAMVGLLELLRLGDLPEEERSDIVKRMQHETERVHLILRRLLDFARPQTEAKRSEGTGDAKRAARHVVELLRPQKQSRDVTMTVVAEPDLPEVAVLENDLEQVLLNLTMNALDEVPHPDGVVVVAIRRDDAFVVIEVRDNGSGVPLDMRETIFEPFATTKEVGKGTGLGLAVCRGIVEAASGTITVGDAEEGGARFEVRLPIRGPESRPATPSTS